MDAPTVNSVERKLKEPELSHLRTYQLLVYLGTMLVVG
jgi:hypothetical protein